MSLYNMMFGVNPATFLFLPMLGKHPDNYPRFRDCGITEDHNIVILTRVGGPNRNSGYGEEEIMKSPYFIKTYDADWDNTYGYYEFKVPEVWKDEFESLLKEIDHLKNILFKCVKCILNLKINFMNYLIKRVVVALFYF